MTSRRPLSLTNLRAFEAVARLLSFGAAAEELHLTQSAISRQIKSLEDELGAALFVRGTRSVQISPDGQTLLRAVEPWLAKLDGSVQQIRRSRSRRRVSVATFASFGSLWLRLTTGVSVSSKRWAAPAWTDAGDRKSVV